MKPLDEDWNDLPAKLEEEMTDAGKTDPEDWGRLPPVFSDAELDIIRWALHMHIIDSMRSDKSEVYLRQVYAVLNKL